MSATPFRLPWVDCFRGLAVVAMIWVHAANSFLSSDLQATDWFEEMTFYHGLIAPAFFWIGGFVRGVRADSGRRPGRGAVLRLLGVLVLGYAPRFPLVALVTGSMTEADWAEMVKVDVLQTLALTGLLMVAVEGVVTSLRLRQVVMGGLMVMIVQLSEESDGWATGWPFVDAMLNRNSGSVFSLFPWMGFGLAGWLCGSWTHGRRMAKMAGVGAVMAWGLPWLDVLSGGVEFFAQRLGWVLVGAWVVAGWMGKAEAGLSRVAATLMLAGRESLVMYVAHLLMIHAVPLPSLALDRTIGKTLPLSAVVGVYLLLLGLSWALAWGNEWRKQRGKVRSKNGA